MPLLRHLSEIWKCALRSNGNNVKKEIEVMKKALSLFMALAALFSCFSGCEKQESQG